MRTFKITVGGETADNLLLQVFCLETGPESTLEQVAAISHHRASPVVFFATAEADNDLRLFENAMVNNHGDITVTDVTGTGWHI